ncbi:hypothetical protein U1Q18_004341 [Sarracenia purpurea var. burkii]
MEGEIGGNVPCSSLAVDSIIRIGMAGVIWGFCVGPHDANKLGLRGIARGSFAAKSAGKFGFQCALFAGVFSVTRCGIQRYRNRNDWMNALIAGAVAGAAVGAGTRSWKQVAGMAGLNRTETIWMALTSDPWTPPSLATPSAARLLERRFRAQIKIFELRVTGFRKPVGKGGGEIARVG